MGPPTARLIAEWVVDEAKNKEFRPLREVIEGILGYRLSQNSPEENADIAESMLDDVVKELQNIEATEKAEGVSTGFELDAEEAYIRVLDGEAVPTISKIRN